MSVVAWDGTRLAADKQFTNAGLKRTGTKIVRVGARLCGFTGAAAHGYALIEWAREDFDPRRYPALPSDCDDRATLIVVDAAGVMTYEDSPNPVRIEDAFMAFGSGRDYAMAAMALGQNAVQAVTLACRFDTGCGMGVDVLDAIPLQVPRVLGGCVPIVRPPILDTVRWFDSLPPHATEYAPCDPVDPGAGPPDQL